MDDGIATYIKTLETHIENKTVFLKQSTESIKKLRRDNKNGDKYSVNSDTWKTFTKKPVMYTEKSDPIGLSLADVSISMRNETSLDWIELMAGKQFNYQENLKAMITQQQRLNQDLETLIQLLEQEEPKLNDIPVSSSLVSQNQALWLSLQRFVQTVLIKDQQKAEETIEIVNRLIRYDLLLNIDDFRGAEDLERLYRLLIRANLLEIRQNSVRLIDFNDDDLS